MTWASWVLGMHAKYPSPTANHGYLTLLSACIPYGKGKNKNTYHNATIIRSCQQQKKTFE